MRIIISHEESPESAIVVAERGSPLTTTIHSSVIKVIARSVLNGVCEIRYRFPVYEILASHDRTAREEVHGCCNEIIIIAYTDNVWIRIVRPDIGILYAALSVAFVCFRERKKTE
jgi:hypothetical protein